MFIPRKGSSALLDHFCFIVISFLCISCLSSSSRATILAGVTIKAEPFINTEHNRFTGLCVDLLDEVQRRTAINYSLYLVQDGLYGPGRMTNGAPMTGLIADVHNKKADFAIGDLTVTDFRQRYVNFTAPFFTFSISALVQRKYTHNIETLDDLAIKSNLTVGAFAGSNTLVNMQRLRKDNVRTIRWLYNRIVSNESNLVSSRDEALGKVYREPYAFIQEEPKNSHLVSKDCAVLKVLRDPHYYFYGRYAIAFRKDSPYLKVFSRTIKQLGEEGFLDKLKNRYFPPGGCSRGGASSYISSASTQHFLLLTASLIAGMFIQKFNH